MKKSFVCLLLVFFGFVLWLLAAEAPIIIDREGGRIIPFSLEGFPPEIAGALKFDLELQGFINVQPDQAQYQISGSYNGRLTGQVTDRITKAAILAMEYSGEARAQAHAFSDQIVEKLTGRKGIGQTKIALKVDTGRNSEIYIADYDGHNAIPVTNDGTISAGPSWVPGRRMLYYYSYKLNNPDIYSYDLDSGVRKIVARYSGSNISPAVSPDGRKVAMILSKSGSPDVYISDADGSNLKQLTTTKEDESSPCWSPDGRTICFVSRASGRPALYMIPASGGEMQRVRTAGILNPTEPDWSPDGSTIAFTAMMGGFNLCTVPADGGEATVLVSGEDPSWAPNSQILMFTSRRSNRRVLSLLDVRTKRVKDIAQISGSCSQPSWTR